MAEIDLSEAIETLAPNLHGFWQNREGRLRPYNAEKSKEAAEEMLVAVLPEILEAVAAGALAECGVVQERNGVGFLRPTRNLRIVARYLRDKAKELA